MIIKFLGLMDIVAAIVLLLSTYDHSPWRLVFILSVYLIIKGVAWKGSIPSFLDLCIGVYMLMTLFFASGLVSWLSAVYLTVKGAQSLF